MAVKTTVDVRFVPLESVHLWTGNPWKHDAAVPRLAELLAIHGQVSSAIVWRKNNVVYKGNHTKKALEYLRANLDKVAHAIKEPKEAILERINPALIKVEFRDFPSEAAANAYGISDNNASLGGEYDDEILKRILQTNEEFYNSKRTGFTEKELKSFLMGVNSDLSKLENVDLQGDLGEMGEFMVLTFDNKAVLDKFKEAFSLGATDRKIDFSLVIGAFNEEWCRFFDPV